MRDDRPQPLLPSRRSARPQAQGAERQVDVVDDDAELRGFDAVFLAKSRTASPEAFMYVCGSARSTGSSPILPRPDPRRALARPDPDSLLRRQRLHHAEAGVVAGRLVLVPGIPEADDGAQRLLLLFLLLLLGLLGLRSAPSSSATALPFFRTSGSVGSAAASAAATGSSSRVGCATWTTTFSGLSTIVTPSIGGSCAMRIASPIAELRHVHGEVRRDVRRAGTRSRSRA